MIDLTFSVGKKKFLKEGFALDGREGGKGVLMEKKCGGDRTFLWSSHLNCPLKD